jgi:hypothetical protein
MKALFDKIEFKPHSDIQRDICYSTHRFTIPCCGRRWGKSLPSGHRMTYKSFVPDSYNWIVGPTYQLGEKEFRVVYRDYEKLGLLPYCKKSYSVKQGDMRIETPWKSVIEVASADKPNSLQGEGLSHAIMSEAASHTRVTWEQYIEPALSDLLGTCDFPSTPKGFNWYHGLWEMGNDSSPETKDYYSYHAPSWTNSVRFPGGLENEEINRLRSMVSRVYFDQEYGALFTSIAGAIYEEWDERIHVQRHTFNPNWPNYQAFDYGFVNPFVCLDIQVAPDDTLYIWREYYGRYLSTLEHGIALKSRDNPQGFRIDGSWGDPRGADEAATLAMVYNYVASQDVSWKMGVEEIKRLLKAEKVKVDPSCLNTIRQMGQLHVKQTAANTSTKQDVQEFVGDGNIQHKVDDHACDALRYFVGPYFVLGANTHLADIYGKQYIGSESHDFFTLHTGITI